MTSFELFAGDCAIFTETGEDMAAGTSYLFSHLRKFGLKMHVGSGSTASKTEAINYPAGTVPYENGDTTPFAVLGPVGEDLGPLSSTNEFGCLGFTVHSSLTPDSNAKHGLRQPQVRRCNLKNFCGPPP